MTDILSTCLLTQKNTNNTTNANRRVKLIQNTTKYTKTTPSLPPTATKVLKPSLKRYPDYQNGYLKAAKSVQFDIPLEHIQHFSTLPPIDDNEEESDEEEKLFDRVEEEEESDEEEKLFHIVKEDEGYITLFNWPSVHPTRRFLSQMVSLENIQWNNQKRVLEGTILVHNLAYEKALTIRYTFDHWKTQLDIGAHYKEAAFNSNALDRFQFEIPLETKKFTCINLAICYKTNNQEFWDNNDKQNYIIHFHQKPKQNTTTNQLDLLHELYYYLASIISSENSYYYLNQQNRPSTNKALIHDLVLIKNSSPPYLSI